MTAASELNFSRPGSTTADPPVQDTAPSNPPKNTINVAGNLNHLEMLSQYTRPGVAISVAQQEALYREYLQAQLQQSLSDQKIEQANSPSGSGKVNPVNQVNSRRTKCRTPTTSATFATSPATNTRYRTNELHFCT